jgi:hypothetical protein
MKNTVLILIFTLFLLGADGCISTRESRLNRRHFRTEDGMGERHHHDLIIIKHKHDRFGNQEVYKVRKDKRHHRRDYDF